MYVFATFVHSNYVELAITAIQMKGIAKDNILGVSMDKKREEVKLFDSIHASDGLSLLDLPILMATIFCLFGSIYGFLLIWGPVLWGIISMILGFSIGLFIKLMFNKKFNHRQRNEKATEVVVIIECNETQVEMIKDLLWDHHALGVQKLDLNRKE